MKKRAKQLPLGAWSWAHSRIRWRSLIPVILFGLSILFTVHYVSANAQQRCASLRADASIPLPPPQPGYNARTWEAAFEAIAAARVRQLGCPP